MEDSPQPRGRLSGLRRQLAGEGLRAFLIRGFLGSGALRVASAVLGLATAIVLARALGPDGYGVYAFAFSLVSVLAIPAQLGLPTLLVREVARYQQAERWGLLSGLLRRANQAVLALSAVLLAAAAVVAWLAAGDITPVKVETFAWALLLVPLIALGNLRGSALQGLRLVVQGLLPELAIRPALLLALAGGVALFGTLTPPTAMALHALAAAVAFAIGVVLLLRALPAEVKEAAPAYETRAWLSSVLPLSLISGMAIINSQTDIVLLGLLTTSEDVGLYRVAVQGATLVIFTLGVVNAVIAPQITRLYHAGDTARLQRMLTSSARVVLATSAPVALALAVFGAPILRLVFGAEYTGGSTALAILCLGQLVNAVAGSVGLLLNMTGNERDTARGLAVSAASNVVLNLVLIPPFGIEGAAAATGASVVIWNVLLVRRARQKLGIDTVAVRLGRPGSADR